jgi:hypothetical protein
MNRRHLIIVLVLVFGVVAGACNKPFLRAKTSKDVEFESKEFGATANECYYALRYAFKINGYMMGSENLKDGILTTTWEPVTAGSHYLQVFDSRDYGVTGAYHQLEARVVPRGHDRTKLEVGSRVKSVASGLKSSGVEERKILAAVGNYLRKDEPIITNDGMEER